MAMKSNMKEMNKTYWLAKESDTHKRAQHVPEARKKILTVEANTVELHVAQILFLILRKKEDQ